MPPEERRLNPFSNVEDTDWGKQVTAQITALVADVQDKHAENREDILELRHFAKENREAIAENTRITKEGFAELKPVLLTLRRAKSTGRWVWAKAVIANKIGRVIAGLVGLASTVVYLMHEKWTEAWRALLSFFK